jgi:phospho-N-acetylmuramoyl-pentapeptide-transferase
MEMFITALIGFAVSSLLGPIIIPFLKKLKFGQSIREIGPSWHNSKSGTPTMGGIIFGLGLIFAMLWNFKKIDNTVLLALLCSLGFGFVGFIDDFIKVVLKRNLGLRAWQKLSLQIIVSVLFIFSGLQTGVLSTVVLIPFAKVYLDLEWLYIPFALFILLGVVNSVNLTDGLDGLATSVTIVVIMFFAAERKQL